MSSSSYYTAILKKDNTLWVAGYNGSSQLGLGDTNHRNTFTQVTTNADDIKSVYCGESHTIILKNDGTLWGCGRGQEGQLGLGNTNAPATFTEITTNTDDIKSVYCGYYYVIILKNDGTLWGTGNIDFRIAMKTKDVNKTPYITKIYIEYKNN